MRVIFFLSATRAFAVAGFVCYVGKDLLLP